MSSDKKIEAAAPAKDADLDDLLDSKYYLYQR